MTDISALAERVASIADTYARCDREQALVYACEDTVEHELGSRILGTTEAGRWLADVCEREDVDPPEMICAPSFGRVKASVDIDARVVCIRRSRTTTSTLLHELAHLTCGADSHRELFRDELVRLTRAHVSIDHAALLHALFTASGLNVGPWPASERRR